MVVSGSVDSNKYKEFFIGLIQKCQEKIVPEASPDKNGNHKWARLLAKNKTETKTYPDERPEKQTETRAS